MVEDGGTVVWWCGTVGETVDGTPVSVVRLWEALLPGGVWTAVVTEVPTTGGVPGGRTLVGGDGGMTGMMEEYPGGGGALAADDVRLETGVLTADEGPTEGGGLGVSVPDAGGGP